MFGGIQGDTSLKSAVLDSFSFHHIGINVWSDTKSKGNPLLLDKNVRQALGYALDRNQIAQIAYAGQATPGDSILMPTFGDFYWKPTGDAVIDNNPDKANQLLDAAGYTAKDSDGIRQTKDGKPLKFRIIAIDSTSVDVRTAQLFQASALKAASSSTSARSTPTRWRAPSTTPTPRLGHLRVGLGLRGQRPRLHARRAEVQLDPDLGGAGLEQLSGADVDRRRVDRDDAEPQRLTVLALPDPVESLAV